METLFPYALTVTELTQQIKDLLEEQFPDVWVEAEISNLRVPPSGHLYFTLKDDSSQIRAVIFKSQARGLRFSPENGLQVICRGRISLYERRGEYQLIIEVMEPKGLGALQLAFLQLRDRLEKEGLFDIARKKPIPVLPQRIGIVTSPTGAVIRDMIHIIERRFKNVHILLYPVRVQGDGASLEIAQGITYFNEVEEVDVIIIGRGGGSIEDLWPFNEEVVARSIFQSRIPVVSAVGHETDFTIADFVADLRAPTPSAAAELVVPNKREVESSLSHLRTRLENQMLQALQGRRSHLAHLGRRLGDPKRVVETYLLRSDELDNRLRNVMSWILRHKREAYQYRTQSLSLQNPLQQIGRMRLKIAQLRKEMEQQIVHRFEIGRQKLRGVGGKLDALSPLAILERGYSITRKLPSLRILREASQVRPGETVEIRLFKGSLFCSVERTDRS